MCPRSIYPIYIYKLLCKWVTTHEHIVVGLGACCGLSFLFYSMVQITFSKFQFQFKIQNLTFKPNILEDEEGDESPASNQTPGKNKADKLAAAVNGGGGNSLAAAGHKTQCRCGAKNCRKVLF